MTPPKAALDAMTDQSLAFARDHRADAEPEMLRLSGEAAALLVAQFPGQLGIAGRVVMCVAQQVTGVHALLEDGEGKDTLGQLADVLALAAEQVVREAGAP